MTTNTLSYTELDDYGHCPFLYKQRHIVGIQPKKKAVALREGTMIHRLLQGLNLATDEYTLLHDEITENPSLFEDEKVEQLELLEEATRIVDGYQHYFGEENFREEILHVEESFVAILDSGQVISCTPDLVVRDPDGRVLVRDYKSTTQSPTYQVPAPNLQVVMNLAAVSAVYPETYAFQFDRMRKKAPTQPRLTKTGEKRVADLKRIDTTYEVLRDFLTREAPDLLDDPVHRLRLAELRDENRFYYRDTILRNDTYLERGLDSVVAQAGRLDWSWETDSWPRQYHASGYRACDRCPYLAVCRGDLLGWDTEAIMAEEYEPRDTSYKDYETEEE